MELAGTPVVSTGLASTSLQAGNAKATTKRTAVHTSVAKVSMASTVPAVIMAAAPN